VATKAGLPIKFAKLGARQQDMVRIIHVTGGATIREIHDRIPDPPQSMSGLRTQLNRLVRKRLLRKRRSGRHSEILYLPAESYVAPQRGAFERIVDEHFDGSAVSALHALMRLAAAEAGRGAAN
jgi:predicted transcriptional regulator